MMWFQTYLVLGQEVDVRVMKFEDSEHVLHMKMYTIKEYKENVVDHALDTVCV